MTTYHEAHREMSKHVSGMLRAGVARDDVQAYRIAQRAKLKELLPGGLPHGRKGGCSKPPAITVCPHLGSATGSALIYGCGCSASKVNGIEVTVFSCDLYERCVTYQRGELRDDTIKRCSTCEDNPRNKATSPSSHRETTE